MTFKQKIHQRYLQLVQDRIDVFRDMIAALTEDSKNDAKGSAGDKHETALSMMHIEQEKLNHKLKEVLVQKAILEKIDSTTIAKTIIVGSLVKANGFYLYLSAALPKIIRESGFLLWFHQQQKTKAAAKKETIQCSQSNTSSH